MVGAREAGQAAELEHAADLERTVEFEAERPGSGPANDRRVGTLAVDDRGDFLVALRELITAMPGFVLVGEAGSGEEAVRAVERLSPQLVLMDVVMPGMDGVSAARAILSAHPDVMVVLISVDDPVTYPGVDELSGRFACARKQDLCPSELTRLWETQRN